MNFIEFRQRQRSQQRAFYVSLCEQAAVRVMAGVGDDRLTGSKLGSVVSVPPALVQP